MQFASFGVIFYDPESFILPEELGCLPKVGGSLDVLGSDIAGDDTGNVAVGVDHRVVQATGEEVGDGSRGSGNGSHRGGNWGSGVGNGIAGVKEVLGRSHAGGNNAALETMGVMLGQISLVLR